VTLSLTIGLYAGKLGYSFGPLSTFLWLFGTIQTLLEPATYGGGNDQSAGNSVEPTPQGRKPLKQQMLYRVTSLLTVNRQPVVCRRAGSRRAHRGRGATGNQGGAVTPDTPKVRLWGNPSPSGPFPPDGIPGGKGGFAQGELTKSLPGPAPLGPALDRPRLRWADQVGGFYKGTSETTRPTPRGKTKLGPWNSCPEVP